MTNQPTPRPALLPLLSLALAATLVLTSAVVGQEAGQYTPEEYKAYQDITAQADAVKKAGLVVSFLKQWPQSSLNQHVLAAFQNMMKDLQEAKRWAALISAGEQFLAVQPNDIYTVAMLATGYQETKNYKQFVVMGERVFAKNPSGNLAYYLAKANLELNNIPKFLDWGEKAVGYMPDNHEILLELTKKSAEMRRFAQASKYGRQCIKAFQSAAKPEGTPDKTWKDYATHLYATCYYVVGNAAYEQKDYTNAISNLESSTKHYSRNEMAYYHLAQAYWQKNQIDLAMKNFAKAYLLKGSSSSAAKQYLDNLYRSTHAQRLDGIDRVINKAQEELKSQP